MQSLNDLLKTIFSGFKSSLKSVNLNIENTKADLENTKDDLKNTKISIKHQIEAATDLKIDKENPTGTGSFSLNRKPGSVVGSYSHAEGYYTTASAEASHAEGETTTASGDYSHAEGCRTTASRQSSHAEGQNTKASSNYQHVQGKFNIEDSSNVYADIIGNGTSLKSSNAATVDWSGNAWYAGDVYVGSTSSTNKDEGSKKLATEEYVNNSVSGIEIPTTLPNPQSLTLTGAVEGSYDGSSALTVDIPSVPDIPTQLPNPAALTFTGAVTGSYDGSNPISVNIPSVPEIPLPTAADVGKILIASAVNCAAWTSITKDEEVL